MDNGTGDAVTMSEFDALFLAQQEAVGTIATMLRLRGRAPSVEEVGAAAAGMVRRIPRLRACVDAPDARRPEWVVRDSVDFAEHISVVTSARGEEALHRLYADRVSDRIDVVGCPPWRIDIVSGYADDEFAMIVRCHHALGDGVSMALVLLELATGAEFGSTSAPRPLPASYRNLLRGAWGMFNRPAPKLPFNRRGRGDSHVVWARVPRATAAAAQAIATPLGAPTFNDLFLASVAGALQQALPEMGRRRLPRLAYGLIPVNIRAAGSELSLGNCLSIMRVPLPVGEPSAVARLAQIKEAMARGQRQRHAPGLAMFARLGDWAGTAGRSLVARVMYHPRVSNVLCSSPPMPDGRYSFLGRPVLDVCCTTVLPRKHGISLALFGYGDQLSIGVLADARIAEIADLLAQALEEEFRCLAAVAQGADGVQGVDAAPFLR